MIIDSIKPKGSLVFVPHDGTGLLLAENLVVNTGLAAITNRLLNTSAIPTHMAIGSGSAAAAAGDTALGTQLGRVALSGTARVTTTVSNDSVQFTASFPAGTGTGAVTEAGLFDAATGGIMWARSVFAVVNKAAGDGFTIVWTIKFGV